MFILSVVDKNLFFTALRLRLCFSKRYYGLLSALLIKYHWLTLLEYYQTMSRRANVLRSYDIFDLCSKHFSFV